MSGVATLADRASAFVWEFMNDQVSAYATDECAARRMGRRTAVGRRFVAVRLLRRGSWPTWSVHCGP